MASTSVKTTTHERGFASLDVVSSDFWVVPRTYGQSGQKQRERGTKPTWVLVKPTAEVLQWTAVTRYEMETDTPLVAVKATMGRWRKTKKRRGLGRLGFLDLSTSR
ncbi:hypothetical protein V6N11_028879 [Hibiscus sabdariffa]|uniref:Uncharacterized protein n=2 Tax=Hibiscus sabdariffa TaxID=183260 RepID=A0ABR1ZVW4_9ROSI